MCSTDNHPKRVALAVDIPKRLQSRCSFRRKAKDLRTLLPPELEHHQTINHFPSPPWQLSIPCKEQISTLVSVITGWNGDIYLKRQFSITLIASYQANYIICTGASASGRTRNEHEIGLQQQLPLEDPQSSLKLLPPSKLKVERSPALTRRKQLLWNQLQSGHPPMTTILQSPSTFSETVNPYVKLSYHKILIPLQFTIVLIPFPLSFLFNGSLAILPFKVTN